MLSQHPDYVKKDNCGCGSDKARIDYVPDTIYGLSIRDACCRHDFRYGVGGTADDKKLADREFLDNMLEIIESNKKWYYPTWLARRRALTYYDLVVRFGDGSFHWSTN